MNLGIVDEVCTYKDIECLLFESDWFLFEKASPKDVEKIAKLLMEYIKGGEDKNFSYMSEYGYLKEDHLSNFINYNELNLRCTAMDERMMPGARFAGALIYFRYCYDHQEYMELPQLELVLMRPEEKDSDAYFKAINVMRELEREYMRDRHEKNGNDPLTSGAESAGTPPLGVPARALGTPRHHAGRGGRPSEFFKKWGAKLMLFKPEQ